MPTPIAPRQPLRHHGRVAARRSRADDNGGLARGSQSPEAALSFRSCLRLVAMLHELGESGAQVICATHSPILASVPGADIIEIGEHGYRRSEWADLDLTDHWRRYLANPDAYLRRLLGTAGTR